MFDIGVSKNTSPKLLVKLIPASRRVWKLGDGMSGILTIWDWEIILLSTTPSVADWAGTKLSSVSEEHYFSKRKLTILSEGLRWGKVSI
jgi:hypothetical protein